MTKTCVYLGVDIAKETLACFLAGESFEVLNTPKGQRQILARVRRRKGAVVQAGVPVTVANPRQVRDFARFRGHLARDR